MAEPNRTREIFDQAADLPPEERAAFLDRECAGDTGLRERVEDLLAALNEGERFLQSPTAQQGNTTEERAGVASALATMPLVDHEGPGAMIGRYKLLQLIGEGGFGTVFMAEQRDPVIRRVALKIIKMGMDTRKVIARFEAERQALAMMDHPNIAKVLDAGATASGRPYFVMELVKGEPITEYCDRHNLPLSQRLELFIQVCSAVQHAHTKGIVHRDVKPTNVLVAVVDDRPLPKVIDFGIAKAMHQRLTEKTVFTEFRQLIGTLEYMSPEQAGGALDVDTRSDVYSLGVLLYELLTGLTPFDPKMLRSAAYAEIQRIIREVEPEKPSTRLSHAADALPSAAAHRHTDPRSLTTTLRRDLDWVVMKALEKDRGRRYETASDLAADVRRYLSDEPVVAGPPSRGYRLSKLVRRNRPAVAAAAVVAGGLVLALAGVSYGLVVARAERDQKAAALVAEAEQRGVAERTGAILAALQSFFIDGMLGAAHPDISLGQDLTVRHVLDRAAMNVDAFEDRELQAAVQHRLGAVYAVLGLYGDAEMQLTRALETRQQLLRAERPPTDVRKQTIETMLALAQAQRFAKQAGRGEKLVRDAKRMLLELHNQECHETAEADYQLAETLYRTGRESEAAELNRRTIELLSRLEPAGSEGHLHGKVLVALATYLAQHGGAAEAEQSLERALEIHRRASGPLWVATTLTIQGQLLVHLGRLDEAENALAESLAIRREVLPAVHEHLGQTLQVLAVARMRARRLQEAEQFAREALAMYRQVVGEQHEYVATTLVSLGAILASQQRFEEAAATYDEAIAIFSQSPDLPQDHWRLANARSQRGRCLVRLRQFPEAEGLLLQAHQDLARTGQRRDVLALTIDALADLYEGWERPEAAAEWRRRRELAPAQEQGSGSAKEQQPDADR